MANAQGRSRSRRAGGDELIVRVQIDFGNAAGIDGADFEHGVGAQGGVFGRADEDDGGHAGGVGDADGGTQRAVATAVAGTGGELVRAFGQRDAGGEAATRTGGDRAASGLAIDVDLHARASGGGAGDAQLRGADFGAVDRRGDGRRGRGAQVELLGDSA
nr:hypothetical protein [Ottowia testudinis]